MSRIVASAVAGPPSLLAALLADPLDPGYAAAARRPIRDGRASWGWTALGLLGAGLVLGVAAATATAGAPAGDQVRAGLVAEARDAGARTDALTTQRDTLAAQVRDERSRVLGGDEAGRSADDTLQRLQVAAGAEAVTGPGLRVTLRDSASRADGSAPAGTADRRGTVLDRDLSQVVNALWASGAEAIGVGGVRLSPQATIRQAGGAMLIDEQPVSSPYAVEAIGQVAGLETGFVRSDAYVRLAAVSQVYGVGFTAAQADRLDLPAATVTGGGGR